MGHTHTHTHTRYNINILIMPNASQIYVLMKWETDPHSWIYRDFLKCAFLTIFSANKCKQPRYFCWKLNWKFAANPRTIESGYWQKQMTSKKLHISNFNYMGHFDIKYILKYTHSAQCQYIRQKLKQMYHIKAYYNLSELVAG